MYVQVADTLTSIYTGAGCVAGHISREVHIRLWLKVSEGFAVMM